MGHNIKQVTLECPFAHFDLNCDTMPKVSDELKNSVPEHIKEKAREMARQELKRKLEELDMAAGEAKGYGDLLNAVQSHILSLYDLLERMSFQFSKRIKRVTSFSSILDLAAKEEERVWIKRQIDGELDDSRLTEGLTGEATVYKRRGMEKPELGRPQIKYGPCKLRRVDSVLTKYTCRPKRIRFIFDISASM